MITRFALMSFDRLRMSARPELVEGCERKRHGFTLLELIIGIAISSIISIILFNTFYQTNKTVRTIDQMIFMDRRIAVLQNQLEKDVTSIFIPEQLQYEKLERFFYSSNNNKQLKEWTFISTNALQVYNQTSPRIVRVTYQLRESKKSPGEFALFRRESTNLIFGAEKDAVEYTLVEYIKEFTVEFGYKEKDQTKTLKDWPALRSRGEVGATDTKKGEVYKIPEFVNIKVTLWDGALHKTAQAFEFKYNIYAPHELKQKQEKNTIGELTQMTQRVLNLAQPSKPGTAGGANAKK